MVEKSPDTAWTFIIPIPIELKLFYRITTHLIYRFRWSTLDYHLGGFENKLYVEYQIKINFYIKLKNTFFNSMVKYQVKQTTI